MTTTDLGAVRCKVLSHHLRKWVVGKSDVVKFAIDGEGGHVILQFELVGHIGSVQDEVEREGPGFGPIFVLGADESFGPELLRIRLFSGRVGDGVCFGAESACPQQSEMAQSTTANVSAGRDVRSITRGNPHPENSNLLARTGTSTHEWTPCRQTGAHHRRSNLRGNVVGYLECEVLVSTDVR